MIKKCLYAVIMMVIPASVFGTGGGYGSTNSILHGLSDYLGVLEAYSRVLDGDPDAVEEFSDRTMHFIIDPSYHRSDELEFYERRRYRHDGH